MSVRAWIERLRGALRGSVGRHVATGEGPASGVEYVWSDDRVHLDGATLDGILFGEVLPGGAERAAWLQHQSLPGIRLLASDAQIESDDAAPWFFVAESLPDWPPTLLEQAWLTAACEEVDAVVLAAGAAAGPAAAALPPVALYRRGAWRPDSMSRRIAAVKTDPVTKSIGVCPAEETVGPGAVDRRGEYSRPRTLPGRWRISLRTPPAVPVQEPRTAAGPILVTAPFLARGGAEHTLLETAAWLASGGHARFVFATLAPHRRELGDRRADVAPISTLLYSLGDLLHPAAMYGALLALIDRHSVPLLYNANGSTLFYEFARRLRRDRPQLAIVDHLYDHRIGYIDWYEDDLRDVVDCCVAENHVIAETLVARGWEAARVPVVWPCGRPATTIPTGTEAEAARLAIRDRLGVAPQEILILTAARAHPQKRPLDWVELARRCRDLPVRFLWVGGGDLESELDRAIAALGSDRIRRLPFRDDVPALLAAADIACLVSEFEGLPVFLIEALQSGRPFLCTNVGDVGRVLRGSGAGKVSGPPGDLDALEAALREMLPDAAREAMGRAALRTAGRFDVASCASRYLEVFRSATERH